MEFRFTIIRTLILIALLVGFYFLGGFTDPNTLAGDSDYYLPPKAWLTTMAMFVVGAFCVSVIDHESGTMDPISLRPLYIIAGIVLMAGGYFWGDMIRDNAMNHSALLDLSSSFC